MPAKKKHPDRNLDCGIGLRLPRKLMDRLRDLAEQEDRSVNMQIIRCIEGYLADVKAAEEARQRAL